MTWSLAFAPFVGPWAFAALALAAALVAALGLLRRGRGAWLRALVLAALILALAGPELVGEKRERLPAVAALVVDRSASQHLPGREATTAAARTAVHARLAALPGIEVREVVVDGTDGASGDGTRLFEALGRALADVPPERVAGVVAITDGQVHDVPRDAAVLGFSAPVHVLLTGRADEIDRRISLVAAPRFGIVGKPQTLTFRVDDEGLPAPRPAVGVVLRRDGVEIARRTATPGRPFSVEVVIPHPGETVFEAEVAPLAGDLTPLDDHAVAVVRGIRENLRVLLVSGAPHPGERTWRNLLKSDPSVDLVHFTILRPPEKQDLVPVAELSLIAFPTRELFVDKIRDFDLIVFDGYRRSNLLTRTYLANIADRVRSGGAVLVVGAADLTEPGGLLATPLGAILPAAGAGEVIEDPFRPTPTPLGRRHPLIGDLATAEAPAWGRWLRIAPVTPAGDATTLVADEAGRPLLVVARRGEGRVGLLASDQVWLWARGFDGGGPHTALLRRLAHWLTREPDLEEEALRLSHDGRRLVVERRSLADAVGPVTLSGPLGDGRRLDLAPLSPGLWRAETIADVPGPWRASDGRLTAFAHVGPADPLEFSALRSTETRLAPLAGATGGAVRRLLSGTDPTPKIPTIDLREGGGPYVFGDRLALLASRASVARGAERIALAAGLAAAALFFALFAAVWWREGR